MPRDQIPGDILLPGVLGSNASRATVCCFVVLPLVSRPLFVQEPWVKVAKESGPVGRGKAAAAGMGEPSTAPGGEVMRPGGLIEKYLVEKDESVAEERDENEAGD